MTIYRMLKGSPLEPELIRSLEAAYEKTLRKIGLVDRDDPITEMIARKIVEIAQTGVQDPAQLSAMAIKEIGVPNWHLPMKICSIPDCKSDTHRRNK
jgi:hypothetical protein